MERKRSSAASMELSPPPPLPPPESTRHARSATIGDIASPFLRLPREVRDHIYGYITINANITQDDGQSPPEDNVGPVRKPRAILYDTTSPNLLLVHRQIHDEYAEYTDARSSLCIDVCGGRFDHWRKVDLKANLPNRALANTKQVQIEVHWATVTEIYFHSFGPDERLAVDSGRAVPWLPSIVLREGIKEIMSRIRVRVYPDALVVISIDYAGYLDPEDPYTWNMPKEAALVGLVPKLASLFRRDTIFSLAQDATREWPAEGKLVVEGLLHMPLWCSMASNSAEVVASYHAWTAGEVVMPLMPEHEKSSEKVVVRLRPTADENNWRGMECLFLNSS